MGTLRDLLRESRLARVGAWSALACVPGAIFWVGALAFGWAPASTPALGYGVAAPFFAGLALASGLIGFAALRSAHALARSGLPEPPPEPPTLGLARSPAFGFAIAAILVLFAAAAFRSPALSGMGPRWLFLGSNCVASLFSAVIAHGLSRPRERALAYTAAVEFACAALGLARIEPWLWLLAAGLALWEARAGWRARGGP